MVKAVGPSTMGTILFFVFVYFVVGNALLQLYGAKNCYNDYYTGEIFAWVWIWPIIVSSNILVMFFSFIGKKVACFIKPLIGRR